MFAVYEQLCVLFVFYVQEKRWNAGSSLSLLRSFAPRPYPGPQGGRSISLDEYKGFSIGEPYGITNTVELVGSLEFARRI